MDSAISHESLMVEDSLDYFKEEVADNIKMVDAKERNQANGAVCSQKIVQVLSRFRSKHGKAPVNAARG